MLNKKNYQIHILSSIRALNQIFKSFCRFSSYSFFVCVCKGTDNIEGIFLNLSKINDLHLSPQAFAKMSNLRLLKFYMPEHDGVPITSSKVHLDQGLEYLPEELRYLHWHEYPLKTLPFDFEPENLTELSLPCSKVEQSWGGKRVWCTNTRTLIFSFF